MQFYLRYTVNRHPYNMSMNVVYLARDVMFFDAGKSMTRVMDLPPSKSLSPSAI